MSIDSREVQSILERVRARYGVDAPPDGPAEPTRVDHADLAEGEGVYATVDRAVDASLVAFEAFRDAGLDARHRIITSIREAMRRDGDELAQMAHAETGLGRAEDKKIKNRLVTEKTLGPEDLEPHAVTGDHGMTVTEFAPFGVIGAITPTTNPTSTIINNSIAALSAGNTLVFNVHPNAKGVSVENVRRINRAIAAVGGPPDLITVMPRPTIESAQELMRHPNVRILLVTGGPGVVDEARKTPKRAILAGPGNPPVVVDESADIAHAARGIIRGSSFDNNLVCTDEKEVLVVDSKADELLRSMESAGAVVLKDYQLKQLERVIFKEMGAPNKPGKINGRWIGQNAGRILGQIGIAASDNVRLAVAEVPQDHSLLWTEQMMPVLPVTRVRNVDEGIDLAVKMEHNFRHTASIYSNDVDTITKMARAMNCSIFIANASNFAGLGEGGEYFTSFSIATPTGEGLTRPRSFSRIRRLTVAGSLRIV